MSSVPADTSNVLRASPANLSQNSRGSIGERESGSRHNRVEGKVDEKTFQSLLHQFPLVSRQVENGLYSVKRVATYLKKVCQLEEAYSKEMLKATVHETGKLEKVQADGMKYFVSTWIGMQEVIYQTATQHQEFRARVMSAVVLPLQSFYKEAEAKRADVLKRMRQIKQHINSVVKHVAKTKQAALKALASLKAAKDKDRAQESGAKKATDRTFMNKLASRVKAMTQESTPVLQEKAVAACAAFQQSLERANKERRKYWSSDLPRVFHDLHTLEVARLDVMREHLSKYTLIYHDMVSPLEELSTRLVANVAGMNTEADVSQFVESWVSVHGEPPRNTPLKYDLPCSADELKKNRWDGSLALRSNHNSVFGATLDDIMRIQKPQHPAAETPVILSSLITAIKRLNGHNTEGIFRISAPKTELDALHRQFDKGVYEVKATNPHVPAGLLKEWLRELQDPLIPEHMYQPCVDAAKAEPPDPAKILDIYQQLPALTQRVVEQLVTLLKDISQNSQVTLMTVDNLAIVFAPSFLRCNSDDPMEMMVNSKYETTFVAVLFTALFHV